MTWLIALDHNSVYPLIAFFLFVFYIINMAVTFNDMHDLEERPILEISNEGVGLFVEREEKKITDFLQIVESHYYKIHYRIVIPFPHNYLEESLDLTSKGRINHKRLSPFVDEIYLHFKDEDSDLYVSSNDLSERLRDTLACMHFAILNNFNVFIDNKKQNLTVSDPTTWLILLKNIQQ